MGRGLVCSRWGVARSGGSAGGPAMSPFDRNTRSCLSVSTSPLGGLFPPPTMPHVFCGFSVPVSSKLGPLSSPPCLLFPPADEMTVGKVYAALMIFDFYKQNKTSRDQIHQAAGGLSQVPAGTSRKSLGLWHPPSA